MAVDRLLLQGPVEPLRDPVGLRLLDNCEAGPDAPKAHLVDEMDGQILASVIHPQRQAARHLKGQPSDLDWIAELR